MFKQDSFSASRTSAIEHYCRRAEGLDINLPDSLLSPRRFPNRTFFQSKSRVHPAWIFLLFLSMLIQITLSVQQRYTVMQGNNIRHGRVIMAVSSWAPISSIDSKDEIFRYILFLLTWYILYGREVGYCHTRERIDTRYSRWCQTPSFTIHQAKYQISYLYFSLLSYCDRHL